MALTDPKEAAMPATRIVCCDRDMTPMGDGRYRCRTCATMWTPAAMYPEPEACPGCMAFRGETCSPTCRVAVARLPRMRCTFA